MASLLQLLPFICLHLLIVIASTSSNQTPKPYIVYMGSSSKTENGDVEDTELAHLQLLSTIIPSEESERISLIHHYKHAFKGFAAMLAEKEALALSGHEGVVSVFPNSLLQLHTTRSWDFLEAEGAKKKSRSTWSHHKNCKPSSDVIIGVIDTGVWPESPSFNDKGFGKIPSRWKGVCMESPDFNKSNCNRKLIGARYYDNTNQNATGSSRDYIGHGTHTASTAAGAHVGNASYYGLAKGKARGGSPSSRLAIYNICNQTDCSTSNILKAFDDAIHDGVDILSLSLGIEAPYLQDPVAIGAFHAEENGVMVIASAGNSGPLPSTVINTAPWIFTVGASTIDRTFVSTVLLGNGKAFQGSGISLSNLSHSKTYPLAFGKDIATNLSVVSQARRSQELQWRIIGSKENSGQNSCLYYQSTVSYETMILAKAKGYILVDEVYKAVPFSTGLFPFVIVGNSQGFQIINYINSTKNPTATILPTVEVPRYKPAPIVASFSSRGPGPLTGNILKPDVTAPGVAILAAIVPFGEKPADYGFMSGTSMSCPHVSGAAAFIKSVHPTWTSSMIKSALMTTASVYDNIGKPLKNDSGYYANPHQMGAGEISPHNALNPGFVFETTTKDYLRFLCYYGYSNKIIKAMSNTNFNCSKNSSHKLISNINYPSISISKLDRHKVATIVKRTVTNVGSVNATYAANVQAPSGLAVNVYPKKIEFSENKKKVSFKVSFKSKDPDSGYNFGSITWWDGQDNHVRMVFAVNVQ
ncbi:hypothetical protein Pint_05692 [Pistacia integerrima]|uniref:Uncharacterized protein n=1 Tax=Pistacia integerrima TaxID=434235 RepID=A0ACC0Z626_9ROSI|nr:hypothetical protein Pint_05692 [Pistacia integerrima]